MNNDQFRKLIVADGAKKSSSDSGGSSGPSNQHGGLTALGSKQRSSIPMTPRSVAGVGRSDFARQVAERNQAGQTQKTFRSFAPKGSKLANGYVDRARDRQSEEEDERYTRLKALEESLKKEEIDQATYDRLQFEIAGGDISNTHLIKGLDFKLLERIRKGEDVYKEKSPEEPDEPDPESEQGPDLDDELGRLEENEVHAVAKEKAQKKGQLSTTYLAPGKKRSRDQILAEMKAARAAAAKAKEESGLGSKFKKIGAKKAAGSRFERDSKGREVFITVDEDGHEKRKVRKLATDEKKEREVFVPDKNAEVLGMEVPEFYRKKQQEEAEKEATREVDIFDDAEEYDPLGGMDSESGGSESEEEKPTRAARESKSPASEDGEVDGRSDSEAMPPPPKPQGPWAPRNYFKDSKTSLASEVSRSAPSLSDPTVLAALRKAKQLKAAVRSEEEEKDAEREQRLKKLLQSSSRDDEDLDMGFGTNRMEDEADLDDSQIKLSAWGEDDEGGPSGGGKPKRKRGPKKKKGDVNSAADVLGVLERRKAAGS